MSRTYATKSALINAIKSEMSKAMKSAEQRAHYAALENAEAFYSVDSPDRKYVRTGKYGDAPDSTGVSQFSDGYTFEIYMNESMHGYTTGTFSAEQVWEAVESHTHGVIGLSGRWSETKKDIEDIVNSEFSKRFSK